MEPMVFGIIFILWMEATLAYLFRVVTRRPVPMLFRFRFSFMVVWVALVWSGSQAGPIPDHPTINNFAFENSRPCICSPQLKRRIIMQNVSQSGTAQTVNHNGNGLELNILTIDSITIPKYHPRSDYGNLEKLQGSLRREGIQEPVLVYEVDAGGFAIIDGARRLKSAQEMGWTELPCLIKRGITEAEAAHLSYVKNVERKTLSAIEKARHIKSMRENFGYTFEELGVMGYGSSATISNKLKLLDLPEMVHGMIQQGDLSEGHGLALAELQTPKEQKLMAKRIVDFDYSVKITKDKVRRLLSKQAKAKNSTEKPVAIVPSGDIPGVYFKDSKNMDELPDECVHLIVTSPPYCVGMEFEKGISYPDHWKNMKEVMAEASRVLVPGGIMALNVGDIHNYKGEKGKNDFTQIQLVGHKYQSFLRQHKIYLSDIIVWVKATHSHSQDVSKAWSDKTPHTGYRILISHDPIYIFRKKGERDVPSEDAYLHSRITKQEWNSWASGIWMIERVRKMEGHPAIFPDELAYRLVRMFSYVGDTVLDPFLGSGTTIKVARQLGREGIGYERELQYKPVIMRKLGIEEGANPAVSIADYAKQSMGEDHVEEIVAQEEADVPLPDGEAKTETQEEELAV